MEKLLVDNNIVVDLLSKREEFLAEAQQLFTMADDQKVTLIISALTFANTHYLLSKHHRTDDVRKILIKFKILVEIVPLNNKIIELALASDFKDFEDAIQHYTALENDATSIITRNKKDFKNSKLPVMTAKEYISK